RPGYRARRARWHGRPAYNEILAGQVGGQRIGCCVDLPQVHAAIRRQRCADAQEVQLTEACGSPVVGREPQTASSQMLSQQRFQPGLIEWCPAVARAGDLAGVHVEREDAMAELGHAHSVHQAHVAYPQHRYLHSRARLVIRLPPVRGHHALVIAANRFTRSAIPSSRPMPARQPRTCSARAGSPMNDLTSYDRPGPSVTWPQPAAPMAIAASSGSEVPRPDTRCSVGSWPSPAASVSTAVCRAAATSSTCVKSNVVSLPSMRKLPPSAASRAKAGPTRSRWSVTSP